MPNSLLDQSCPCEDATDPLAGPAALLDQATGAALAQMTGGLSPASIGAAFSDWISHLAMSPGKRLDLGATAIRNLGRLAEYATGVATGQEAAVPPIMPRAGDMRFSSPAWRGWPYCLFQQGFLLAEQWVDETCCSVGGVTQRHEDMVRFALRQMLDTLAPSNFATTNPAVQRRIAETGGQCLVDGWVNWLDDMQRWMSRERPKGAEAYRPGHEVAITPGKVVFRNHLIELIQYGPATDTARPEPLLIVPAWIMKFYILDLSPANSLVRWLIAQGFTVFMISWRNPDAGDREIGLDDYRSLGVMVALDAITAITGAKKVHAAGYCLGGTLTAITAATMARDGDERLASMTLFAAQTEFSEPGELGLFIDASQVHFLEDLMWAQGFLDSRQMGSAFQILRSNDLIWSRLVHGYLMGEAEPMNDLMAWNADGTRLPQAMHSQYLRRLFLDDALAEGHYRVDGKTIALGDIRCPIFAVGTEWDHVAPWRSVFKIHMLTETEVTFVLTSGGHNAGIVSEPGHKGRHFRTMTHLATHGHVDPDQWMATASLREGSWWPAWGEWLFGKSGAAGPLPPMGNADAGYVPLEPAPGHYVFES